MSTLLMRLAAPLQSWGTESKFDIRKTGREPTKSGVIGLLAAALGRSRDEKLDDLCELRFGVRVDREGELLRDFHMVSHMVKGKKVSYVTYRYYLSDAVFLAGVESENEEFLNELDETLRHPAYPLYLGRRSCPPTQPISLGIRLSGLKNALEEEPWQSSEYLQKKDRHPYGVSLRILLDSEGQESVVEKDYPITYDPRYRQYGYRAVTESEIVKLTADQATEHDPMKELGD